MKDVRCLLGSHSYVQVQMDDSGGTYLQCRRCGHVEDSASDPTSFGKGMKGMNDPFA